MRAYILEKVHDLRTETEPLRIIERPIPVPATDEILIRVSCCGVCHTELDEIEGRTPPSIYPMVLGHQVVGVIEKNGATASRFRPGNRVGVAWIYSACGKCEFCHAGLENLCPQFKGTGRDAHGGYAEYMTVAEDFAFLIPPTFRDVEAAPLLCAGAIGYRSLRLTEIKNGETLGLAGFGASGHLVLKMARSMFPESKILVFARSKEEQSFALVLGAAWAGTLSDTPPWLANAIIDTTPAWGAIMESLLHLKPGGKLVINAIRKEESDKDILQRIRYHDHLWMEKEIKSVANITRQDVTDFLALAASIPLKPEVELYSFAEANQALRDLKHRHVKGAKVLMINEEFS